MDCPACAEKRRHTDEDWQNHPFKGHGFTKEHGWSHPGMKPSAISMEPIVTY